MWFSIKISNYYLLIALDGVSYIINGLKIWFLPKRLENNSKVCCSLRAFMT